MCYLLPGSMTATESMGIVIFIRLATLVVFQILDPFLCLFFQILVPGGIRNDIETSGGVEQTVPQILLSF